MPFALYDRATGRILNRYYVAPTNINQLNAFNAQGLAIMEVDQSITPDNSFIDLNTNQPAATGPAMTYIFLYNYDASTGIIGSWTSGNKETALIPQSSGGLVVSTSVIPALRDNPGGTLAIDGNGMPALDDSGNYVVTSLPAPEPPLLVQLTAALMANGMVDSTQFGSNTIAAMDTSLSKANLSQLVITSPTLSAKKSTPALTPAP